MISGTNPANVCLSEEKCREVTPVVLTCREVREWPLSGMSGELGTATARREKCGRRLKTASVQNPWQLSFDFNLQKGPSSCKDGKVILPSRPNYWQSLGLVKNGEKKPAAFVADRERLFKERIPVFLEAGRTVQPTDVSEDIRGAMFAEPTYDKFLLNDTIDYVEALVDEEVMLNKNSGNPKSKLSLAAEILNYVKNMRDGYMPNQSTFEKAKESTVTIFVGTHPESDPHRTVYPSELYQESETWCEWSEEMLEEQPHCLSATEIISMIKSSIHAQFKKAPTWAQSLIRITGFDTEGCNNLGVRKDTSGITKCNVCRKDSCKMVAFERIHFLLGDLYITIIFPRKQARRGPGGFQTTEARTESLWNCELSHYTINFLAGLFQLFGSESGLVHSAMNVAADRGGFDKVIDSLGLRNTLDEHAKGGKFKILFVEGNIFEWGNILGKAVPKPVSLDDDNPVKQGCNALQLFIGGTGAPFECWKGVDNQGHGNYRELTPKSSPALVFNFIYHLMDCVAAQVSSVLGLILCGLENINVILNNDFETFSSGLETLMEAAVRDNNPGLADGWKLAGYQEMPEFSSLLDQWKTGAFEENYDQGSNSSLFGILFGAVETERVPAFLPDVGVSEDSLSQANEPRVVSPPKVPKIKRVNFLDKEMGKYGQRASDETHRFMEAFGEPAEEQARAYLSKDTDICLPRNETDVMADVYEPISDDEDFPMDLNLEKGDNPTAVLVKVRAKMQDKSHPSRNVSKEDLSEIEAFVAEAITEERDAAAGKLEQKFNPKNNPNIKNVVREINTLSDREGELKKLINEQRSIVTQAQAKLVDLGKQRLAVLNSKSQQHTKLMQLMASEREAKGKAQAEVEHKIKESWKDVYSFANVYKAEGETKVVLPEVEVTRLGVSDTRSVVLPDLGEPPFSKDLPNFPEIVKNRFVAKKQADKMVGVLMNSKLSTTINSLKGKAKSAGICQKHVQVRKGILHAPNRWTTIKAIFECWERLVQLGNFEPSRINENSWEQFKALSKVFDKVCKEMLGAGPTSMFPGVQDVTGAVDLMINPVHHIRTITYLSTEEFDNTVNSWIDGASFAPGVPDAGPQEFGVPHAVATATTGSVEEEGMDDVDILVMEDPDLVHEVEQEVEKAPEQQEFTNNKVVVKSHKAGLSRVSQVEESGRGDRHDRSRSRDSRHQEDHRVHRREWRRGEFREYYESRSYDRSESRSYHDRSESRSYHDRSDGRSTSDRYRVNKYGGRRENEARSRNPEEQRLARR